MARETMAKGGWDAARDGDLIERDQGHAQPPFWSRDPAPCRDSHSLELLLQDMLEKVKHNPDNVNFRRQLANLYAQGNRSDDAIRTLEERRSSAGDPDDQALSQVRLKEFDFEIAQARENGDKDGVGYPAGRAGGVPSRM